MDVDFEYFLNCLLFWATQRGLQFTSYIKIVNILNTLKAFIMMCNCGMGEKNDIY